MKKLFVISLVAMAISLASCSSKENKTSDAEKEKIEAVCVKTLEKTKISRVLTFSTNLQAYNKVNVAPALQGRIVSVNAEVGDYVQKGQLIAKMDQNQYIQTKLQYENLKVDFARISALNDSNNIAKQTYDQMKSQITILETALKNLETNTYVRAPFSGYIASRNYEAGELFSGLPIYELIDLTTLKAFVNIPESYFPVIKQGMKLDIKSDLYKDQSFPATIEIIYPTIDQNTHTFTCQVKIPNAGKSLRPGMYVSTNVFIGDDQTVVAPYNSVLKLQGSDERYVFINDNGYAKRVVVKFGQRFDDNIELVADDIKEGVELVIQGQSKLNQGTKLNITRQ